MPELNTNFVRVFELQINKATDKMTDYYVN